MSTTTNLFGPLGELEGKISDTGPVKEWIRAVCPMCSKEYLHTAVFKPKTCGMLECARKLRDQK